MATAKTPFTLAYYHEAMSQVKVEIPTYKVRHFEQLFNDRRLDKEIDLLELIREEAEIMMATYKKWVECCFNQRVYKRLLKFEDLVLKKIGTTIRDEGNLGPQWESLYVVITSNRRGVYWLPRERVATPIER